VGEDSKENVEEERISMKKKKTKKRMEYKRKTDEEIKALAMDLVKERIFTSSHLRNPEETSMVFLPLSFTAPADIKELKRLEASLLYEYWEKALPRSVNGLHMFGSLNWLDKKDHQRLTEQYKKIKEAMEKV